VVVSNRPAHKPTEFVNGRQFRPSLPNLQALRPLRLRALQTMLSLILAGLVSACNAAPPPNPIIESENTSLRATIDYLRNLEPTYAAQQAQVEATVQAQTTQIAQVEAQNRELTARLNAAAAAGQNVPTSNSVNPPTADPNAGVSAGQPTPIDPMLAGVQPPTVPSVPQSNGTAVNIVTDPIVGASGMTISRVSISKAKNSKGCAVEEINQFRTTDPSIYVIAVVTNFKKGTRFTSTWVGGGLNQTYDWTADYESAQDCISFYIFPSQLGILPGTYTVTFSATEITSPPIQFTIEQG